MTRLIRAEMLKIFTTRLWWGLLIGVAASSAAFAGLIAGVAGRQPGMPGIDDPATVRTIYTQGLSVAYLFALAFGIIAMAGEFRHQTMTATALSSPHRLRIVLSKLVAVSLVGLGYGVVTVLASVGVGVPVVVARGGEARLTTDGVPRALLLAVVAVALWAVIGLGIGTLLRNQIVALLVTIGVAWIVEPLLVFVLNAVDAGAVARFLPTAATSALVTPSTTNAGYTSSYLPWWGGASVLLGYAALSGALGAALTLRRDIS